LLFFRPVPGFEATESSMEPSVAMITLQRDALAEAVELGQLGPAASSDEAISFLAIIIIGSLAMEIANEPELPWGAGRFSTQVPRLVDLLVALYPPTG
jgi:hypothetical protein